MMSPGEQLRIHKAKLLYVEGKDEENLFEAFFSELGLVNLQVLSTRGKYSIAEKIMALTRLPGFSSVTTLGIVRDANSNANGAFQSLANALRQAGLPCPNQPEELADGTPKTGVLILPGPTETGALEDVCLKAVAGELAFQCMTAFFDCLVRGGNTLPRELSKAKVRVFLASRPDVNLRLGEAALRKYWPLSSIAFEPIIRFIGQVAAP